MIANSTSSISFEGLSVKAGSRQLLTDASAEFPAGEISIIVGPSGVGKSVLLKIIAGLIKKSSESIEIKGTVYCDKEPVRSGNTGVVFQSFALFDELSPKGNLDFAKSCGNTKRTSEELNGLLNELNVPSTVPTSRLSGGQRQRLAIARTLAFDPPVILYDEPTSGLDPSTGEKVANLIRDTHDQYDKTSIIVTHDYNSLLPIADRVFLFDPIKQKIEELPKSEWEHIGDLLEPLSSAAVAGQAVEQVETVWSKSKAWTKRFLQGTSKAFEALLIALLSLLPLWKNFRWGVKFLVHFGKLVFGPTAILYLAVSGIIVGFVTTYFAFEFLPYATYTEPLLIEDLLGAMGFAIYRIFVPVLATVLIAARSGAAVTADVGGRQYGNQIDAMSTFGATPRNYLLTPIMISFLIGTPILNWVSFYTAKLTSLFAFVLTHQDHGPHFWDFHFHRQLDVLGQFSYFGFGWLMSKLLCCGLAIGAVSYYQGLSPKFSTTDVSRSVTRTILWATLLVLLIHFVFAFFEFESFRPSSLD